MTAHLSDKDFDASRAGKKAANLHRLTQSGHKVPPGFVLYPDEALEALSDDALQQAVDRVGGFPVAVRSSGTLEDLAEASFAGQYETFLEVASLADLREKIEACRASGRTERVRVYLEKQGLRQEAAAVAVLVQRMVPASLAGVAFSIHPVTGKEEHFLIECVKGLGEKLVSGHVSPSRFVVHAETGQVFEKEQTEDGGTLSAAELDQLREALLDVQAEFGAPQDVEWAVDDQGQLFLLQSRPVTKVQWRTDVEEFTNADFKDGGISARVCTPLMYSLYRDAVTESMQRYFEGLRLLRRGDQQTWIGFYYGRGYWNASAVKRALCKIPGFHEEKFDQDLGIQKDYGHSGPRVIPTTPKTLLGAIPVAVALEVSYRRQLGVAREYGQTFQRQRQAFLDRIARFQATEDSAFWRDIEAVFRDFHGKTEQAYFTTIYNNANAQSDFKNFLAKMDAALGRTTSMIHLMGGLSNVSHMDVQRGYVRLHRVAQEKGLDSEALSQALAAFLRVHGFHADAELDLTCPRWSEAPERVREHVATMVRSALPPADPDKTEALQRRLYQDEVDAIEQGISGLPLGKVRFLLSFRSHLGRVRGYLSAREKMREYSTQTYAVVRAYVVEAGRRFHGRGTLLRADDVFMLHTDEVLALAQGRENVEQARRKITFRRKMYDGYRDFLPPNELGRGVEVRGEESFEGKNVLQGLGCSPGVVEGTVCVVPTLEDVHRLRKGDILVTRFTDPGWTPVLGMVAAVVTEVGGLLSHAAVIGREYGIPAVLNLPGATRALKSGQRVRVDGSTGRVELLADASAGSGASSGSGAEASSGAAAEE